MALKVSELALGAAPEVIVLCSSSPVLLHFGDHRREQLGLAHRAARIGQLGRHKALLQISVQQRAHAFRKNQRREKILIEALSADQEETFVPNSNRPDREQTQIHRVGRVHAAKESALRVPVRFRAHPIVFVTEARGPLRGRNQRAVIRHDVDEIELLRLGDAARVVVILGRVGLRAVQVHGHPERGLGIGNALHAMRDFVSALRVFAAKLRHEGVGPLAVKFLERAARVDRHAPRHQRHRRDDGHYKKGQQLGAEAHGELPPAADGGPSQTSSSLHPPQRGAIQSRTCGLSP